MINLMQKIIDEMLEKMPSDMKIYLLAGGELSYEYDSNTGIYKMSTKYPFTIVRDKKGEVKNVTINNSNPF